MAVTETPEEDPSGVLKAPPAPSLEDPAKGQGLLQKISVKSSDTPDQGLQGEQEQDSSVKPLKASLALAPAKEAPPTEVLVQDFLDQVILKVLGEEEGPLPPPGPTPRVLVEIPLTEDGASAPLVKDQPPKVAGTPGVEDPPPQEE